MTDTRRSRLLCVIVTHNYLHYASNTIRSCLEFVPEGDVLVLDNFSTNTDLIEHLKKLDREEPRLKVVFRSDNDRKSKSGSLSRANNDAVEYGLNNGYDYFFFIQDDMQFVRHEERLLEMIDRAFDRFPDIGCLNCSFVRGVSAGPSEFVGLEEGGDFYKSELSGGGATEVRSAEFFRETGFRFSTRETDYAAELFASGYRTYYLRNPILMFIPWPTTRRWGKQFGRERPPREKYYYKPLDTRAVAELKNRPVGELPFAEDYCLPWGYVALTPYWLTTPSWEYFRWVWFNCPKLGVTRRRLKFVGDLAGGRFERGIFSPAAWSAADREPRWTEFLRAFGWSSWKAFKAAVRVRSRLKHVAYLFSGGRHGREDSGAV